MAVAVALVDKVVVAHAILGVFRSVELSLILKVNRGKSVIIGPFIVIQEEMVSTVEMEVWAVKESRVN